MFAFRELLWPVLRLRPGTVPGAVPAEVTEFMDALDRLGRDSGAWSTYAGLAPAFSGTPLELAELCATFANGTEVVPAAETPKAKAAVSPFDVVAADLPFILTTARPNRWTNVQFAGWAIAEPATQLAMAASAYLTADSRARCAEFRSAPYRAAYLSGPLEDAAGLWAEDERRVVSAGREAGRRRRARHAATVAATAEMAATAATTAQPVAAMVMDNNGDAASVLLRTGPTGLRSSRGDVYEPSCVAAIVSAELTFVSAGDKVYSQPQWQRLVPSLLAAATSRTTPDDVRAHLSAVLSYIASEQAPRPPRP